jgi:hypothetical protein
MNEPRVSRPDIPEGYGVPKGLKGALPWSWAVERLESAPVYWVASVRPNGRPHLMPTWGAWVDGAFWMEGSPATRRMRNLTANPAAAVSIQRGDDVVIVEGDADRVIELDDELTQRLLTGFAKYKTTHGYEAEAESWRAGIWRVTPRKVMAWSKFPKDTTRWTFDE